MSYLLLPVVLLRINNDARAKGSADRKLYFQNSVKAIIELLVALDILFVDESDRHFKTDAPVSAFRDQFAHLLDLSAAQVAAVDHALRSNPEASRTIKNCTFFLLNWVPLPKVLRR